jgi:hypothetical protein
MQNRAVNRVIWVSSLFAILLMIGAFARAPLKTPKPGKLETYTTNDKTISILHPDNWEPKESGSQGTTTRVTFDPTDAVHFSVTSDVTASLIADIAKGDSSLLAQIPGSIGKAANKATPLESVHATQGARLQSNTGDYPEFADGQTSQAEIADHEAIITEFTYFKPSALGRISMVGKRITLLFTDRGISMICACPKEQTDALMPTFDRMINSVKGQ